MDIADLLTPGGIVLDARLRDKAHLISESARLYSALMPEVTAASVEAALMAREQLGSTGLGAGFALPHARIDGLRDYAGLFLRLGRPIDFAAIDGWPVDLAFVLLIPFDTTIPQVSVLAAIARRMRDTAVATGLRTAATPSEALDLLTDLTKS